MTLKEHLCLKYRLSNMKGYGTCGYEYNEVFRSEKHCSLPHECSIYNIYHKKPLLKGKQLRLFE
jgi:hypothetical protein